MYRIVPGHEKPHIVAKLGEGNGQGAHRVAQAAGLGEGNSLAADHQYFHNSIIQAAALSRNEDNDREMRPRFEAALAFRDEDAWEEEKMRRQPFLFLVLPVVLIAVLSCSGIQRGAMGRISATVRFETGLERTGSKELPSLGNTSPILPGGGWTPLKFVLSGSGPNGASFSQESQDGIFSRECESGEWVLEAIVISQDNKELARGECISILQPGRTINAEIVLYPLEGKDRKSVV